MSEREACTVFHGLCDWTFPRILLQDSNVALVGVVGGRAGVAEPHSCFLLESILVTLRKRIIQLSEIRPSAVCMAHEYVKLIP
jgi:hypothetical protein